MTSRQLLLTLSLCTIPLLGEGSLVTATPLGQGRPEAKHEIRGTYTSPSGLFSMPIPVWESLGGRIDDDKMYVNFMDDYTTHITVGVIQMDATFRWELSTMGKKDFLINVFNSVVMPQLKAACPQTSSDSAKLIPKFKDGALVIGTLHPGTSHFIQRTLLFGRGEAAPTARRGTMIFTQGDYIFILSSELGERATERSAFTLTPEQENESLKDRLVKLARSLTITLPEDTQLKP